jgi:hypothetical protein
MPNFRYPVAIEPLLKIVRSDEYRSREEAPKFPTNAHVLTLAACYGFYLCRKKLAQFVEDPPLNKQEAMKESVFRNNDLMSKLLTVAIAHTGSSDIVRDEARFAGVIQSYAHIGGEALSSILISNEENFLMELVDLSILAVNEHLSVSNEN